VTAAAVDAMLARVAAPAPPGDARERIERWAGAYARWGRDTMGYALIVPRRAG
jgi:hypothetical protein